MDRPQTHASKGGTRGVLFVCAANAVRSQLAEGVARLLVVDDVPVFSAGVFPGRIHPCVVRVLKELGVDPSGMRAKAVSEVPLDRVDLVVALSPEAAAIPFPPGLEVLHWPIPDPFVDGGEAESAADRLRNLAGQLEERLDPLFRKRGYPMRSSRGERSTDR